MTRHLPDNVRPLREDPVEAFVAPEELTPEMALLVAQTFAALADPTRARIVYALTRGEHSVGDLAKAVGVSPSATSHHLRSLRDLRIVRYRREGNRIYYTVDDAHVALLFREALHHLAHVAFSLPDHPEE
ncbi:helix-turn-helix transcriptional regulator [Candidatus Gracilibacteria bacterium]|nr:helix-turn-helix transcriptional regulator [Candidatus Gracilibacteria bacterium]